MRKFILTFLLLFTLMSYADMAYAENDGLGVGSAIGGPDGLSYKYWLGESSALSGLVSFSISANNSRFYTHIDYLQHKFYDETDWEVGRLYYYYGGGLGYEWFEWATDDVFTLRLPSGLGFDFNDVPFDLYFELAPTIGIAPDFQFFFNGNFGFRLYLN
ncbi:MAG: hypothetical protein WD097_09735 [Balneolales bacterium]